MVSPCSLSLSIAAKFTLMKTTKMRLTTMTLMMNHLVSGLAGQHQTDQALKPDLGIGFGIDNEASKGFEALELNI